MTARLPIGVVGVGALGQHHARHLATLPDAELIGVYDHNPTRAREIAAQVGTKPYHDLDDLLARVRAVSIAVPTPSHGEVGCHVLERGIAVLMEKPLAGSVAEADTLIAAARKNAVPLQVGHIERFNRAVRAARPWLEEPRFFESQRLAPFQPRGTDVAVILDLMIHDLDLIIHLLGGKEAVDVRASGVAVLSPHLDMSNARVEFAGGAVANVTTSRLARDRVRKLRIFQPTGYLSLDLASGGGQFLRLRSGWRPGTGTRLDDVVESIALEAPEGDALRMELESFVHAVQGGRETVVTGEEGRAALRLALQVSEAVARQPVVLRPR
ncbi:MAG TPA: Gfo/Idh/MocA family oxidoreductase [Gemmatimonadales bacterium]|nr:Gfo/Idh/MocA family oxidoreductase [Gemmatimonadales bacterium]